MAVVALCRGPPRVRARAPDSTSSARAPALVALGAAAAVAAGSVGGGAGAALAARLPDGVKAESCVLERCASETAACLADAPCAAAVACAAACPPEAPACAAKCAERDASSRAARALAACATVQRDRCLPPAESPLAYPVPPARAALAELDAARLDGRWFAVRGLNPQFDQFDCQVQYFASPRDDKTRLYSKLSWRVPTGAPRKKQFLERTDIQTFAQEGARGVLVNRGNATLNYEDTWYVLGASDDFFAVYYRGSNDALDGYGGAVVYAREPTLAPALVPDVEAALARAGLTLADFKTIDNTCGPEPAAPSPEGLLSFGPRITVFESQVIAEVTRDEQAVQQEIEREIKAATRVLDKVEKRYATSSTSRGFMDYLSTYLF